MRDVAVDEQNLDTEFLKLFDEHQLMSIFSCQPIRVKDQHTVDLARRCFVSKCIKLGAGERCATDTVICKNQVVIDVKVIGEGELFDGREL